jgi:hypothetical protein
MSDIKKKVIEIKNPARPWWSGDPRVEKYMIEVRAAIHRHVNDPAAHTDIYNRAYEAVYAAIKDYADGGKQ